MKSLFGLGPVPWLGLAAGAATTIDAAPATQHAGKSKTHVARAPSCLSGGDETTINQRLASGGTGAQVALCAGGRFALKAPVVYTAARQSIYTEGYPSGDTRATLTVTGAEQTAAVFGNCGACNDISLRNVQVNGNRPALGRRDPGQALLEFGGPTSGQWVDWVHAYEPRAWSALHVIEGNLNCANARITNNDIGPSGNYANFAWADGISMACTNSLVENNTITDATDGAIVLFGAPGTVVRNNLIRAQDRVMLGGVNLVDWGPFSGNNVNTTVVGNTIDAQGALIKVGVAIGPAVWGENTKDRIRGARVLNNLFRGANMGYGIAASGATEITVQGNVAQAQFGGKIGETCLRPLNPAPGAFVYDARGVQGSLQNDFVNGTVRYVLCIEPGLSALYAYAPGQLTLRNGNGVQLAGAKLGLSGTTATVRDGAGRVVWSAGGRSALGSLSGASLTFTPRGQLRLGNATAFNFNVPASGAQPGAGSTLTFANVAPYLRITTPAGDVAWASSYTFPDFKLNAGQFISRTDGRVPTYLVLERDANLRVREGSLTGKTLWSTSVTGKSCATDCFATLQGDGNLVTYSASNAVFATGTNGGSYRVDGVALGAQAPYLRIVDTAGRVRWGDGASMGA